MGASIWCWRQPWSLGSPKGNPGQNACPTEPRASAEGCTRASLYAWVLGGCGDTPGGHPPRCYWKPWGQRPVLPAAACAWLPGSAWVGFGRVERTICSTQTVSSRAPSPPFPSPPPPRMFQTRCVSQSAKNHHVLRRAVFTWVTSQIVCWEPARWRAACPAAG